MITGPLYKLPNHNWRRRTTLSFRQLYSFQGLIQRFTC